MAIKAVVEKLDDVDEVLRPHYKESKNAKDATKVEYVLDLEGSADALPAVKTLRAENASFRIKLRDTETKYGKFEAFKDMDPVEVLAKLDRIAELEAAAGGKLDEKQIETIVEGRIKTKTAPLERQLQTLTTERDQYKAKNDELTAAEKRRIIHDSVRKAANDLRMLPEAVEDAIMYATSIMEVDEEGVVSVKDKTGFTPGLDPKSWLGDMQPKRPHWWAPNQGGGARGGNGAFNVVQNPWTNEHWNMTEQNKIYNADRSRADALAKSAGTKIGGAKPPPKK